MVFCHHHVLNLYNKDNLLFMICIAVTSPVFASVGVMVSIPAAMISEYVFHGRDITLLGALSAFIIIIGYNAF